ncbi:hypothetical protein GmHk_13G036456 [Glycine max]|nr:hypothetical protein GmHk_13G036456 [Glycine max]
MTVSFSFPSAADGVKSFLPPKALDLLHQWSILHLEDHGSGMEKEERLLEMSLQEEDESKRSSLP